MPLALSPECTRSQGRLLHQHSWNCPSRDQSKSSGSSVSWLAAKTNLQSASLVTNTGLSRSMRARATHTCKVASSLASSMTSACAQSIPARKLSGPAPQARSWSNPTHQLARPPAVNAKPRSLGVLRERMVALPSLDTLSLCKRETLTGWAPTPMLTRVEQTDLSAPANSR